jgi:hypothetical protein
MTVGLGLAGLAAVAILLSAAAGRAAEPQLVLEVGAGPELRPVHRERVAPGQTLSLSYVHSSEHVPVVGVFRIEADGALAILETAFGGFGPGLPSPGPGDRWRIRDGLIVVEHQARLPELRLRLVPSTHHRLVTPGGAVLDLSALANPVRVRATPIPRR